MRCRPVIIGEASHGPTSDGRSFDIGIFLECDGVIQLGPREVIRSAVVAVVIIAGAAWHLEQHMAPSGGPSTATATCTTWRLLQLNSVTDRCRVEQDAVASFQARIEWASRRCPPRTAPVLSAGARRIAMAECVC